MKLTGKIRRVSRNEEYKDGVPRIYVTAHADFRDQEISFRCSDFTIYGYEPEANFQIGQSVTVEIGEAS
jgi:hypothetical protein